MPPPELDSSGRPAGRPRRSAPDSSGPDSPASGSPAGEATCATADAGWLAALTLALLFAIGVTAHARIAAPHSARDVARAGFSPDRALATLGRILEDGVPHPVGSAANARVRERIVAELRVLGLDARVEAATACSDGGSCAEVHNIVSSLPASAPAATAPGERASAILLLSHYDSVAAATGANDDGVGVAVTLETLRALLADGAPRAREVLAVITDGEEEGLLGARTFAERDAAAARVALVLNVEARGSAGPSMMFETGPGSGELVRLYGERCRRPIASSVFASIYDRMPNDTDFSVMKRAGLPGLNFAHVRNLEHYHTPRDELRNVSRDTLAHHGQCILALTSKLVKDATPLPHRDLAYFDLLGFGLIRWPIGWTLALALLATAVCAAAALRLGRAHAGAGAAAFARAFAALPAVAFASGVAGHGVVVALRAASGAADPWTVHPLAPSLAVIAAALCAGLLVAAWLRRGTPPGLLWLGVWLPLAGLALALAFSLPAASPPLLAPVLAAALAYALCGAPRSPGPALAIATFATAGATALVLLPWVFAGRDSLGLGASPVATLPIALCIAAALPNLADPGARMLRGWIAGAGAVAVLALIAGLLSPAYDREHPRALSLHVVQDANGASARWLADARGGTLPAALAAVGFRPETLPRPASVPGSGPVFAADATPLALTAPFVELVSLARSGHSQIVTLTIRSQRGASLIGLLIPVELPLEWIEIDGRRALPVTARWTENANGFVRYALVAAKPGGGEFRLSLADATPDAQAIAGQDLLSLTAFDRSDGLAEAGPAGQALLRARPEWAVPIGHGDGVVVTRALQLRR